MKHRHTEYGTFVNLPPEPFRFVYYQYCGVGTLVPDVTNFRLKDDWVAFDFGYDNLVEKPSYYPIRMGIKEWSETKIVLVRE